MTAPTLSPALSPAPERRWWDDDAPDETVCPVLGAFVDTWGRGLPDDDRERLLRPFVSRLPRTLSTPGVTQGRGYRAWSWLQSEFGPAWQELAPVAVPPLTTEPSPVARLDVHLARVAAGAAAWEASLVGRVSTWEIATWVESRDAAWKEGRQSPWEATMGAARGGPPSSLGATIARLQASAVALLEDMLAVEASPAASRASSAMERRPDAWRAGPPDPAVARWWVVECPRSPDFYMPTLVEALGRPESGVHLQWSGSSRDLDQQPWPKSARCRPLPAGFMDDR